MTCNPKWAEIQQELVPNESLKNKPDLITRVFRAKLVHLSKLTMNKKNIWKSCSQDTSGGIPKEKPSACEHFDNS